VGPGRQDGKTYLERREKAHLVKKDRRGEKALSKDKKGEVERWGGALEKAVLRRRPPKETA